MSDRMLHVPPILLLEQHKGFLENLDHLLAVLGGKSLEIPVKLLRNFEVEWRERCRFRAIDRSYSLDRGSRGAFQ